MKRSNSVSFKRSLGQPTEKLHVFLTSKQRTLDVMLGMIVVVSTETSI